MHDKTARRTGFSLIELLVVVAIIAVLVALSVGVIRAVMESQQQSITEATMKTVNKVLQQHWTYVIKEARDKDTPSAAVMLLAGNDPTRAKVIWTKLRLIDAFPEKYDEVLSASPAPPPPPALTPAWQSYGGAKYVAGYRRALTAANITLPSSAKPDAQASALLLLALSVRRGGASLNLTELGTAIKDTDGDGLKELVDGWGRPIRLVRFPTAAKYAPPELYFGDLQNKVPAQAGSKAAKFCDPLDPDGFLLNENWYKSAYTSLINSAITTAGGEYDELFHPIYNQPPPNAVANYVIPVLVSKAGDPANSDDDIRSYDSGQN